MILNPEKYILLFKIYGTPAGPQVFECICEVPVITLQPISVLYIQISNLLTYFMELSPSGGAANSAATQEFPSILWNQKPSTGPYPEPDLSNPYHPILYL
jgi:hypothetical protein